LFGFFAAITHLRILIKVMFNSKQVCKKKTLVLSFKDEK
jgi:hypothetical protein